MEAKRRAGSPLAYAEAGDGEVTVVFLHGNPTSSHIWRRVIPHLADRYRCLAPDLIGMGASEKPDLGYRFEDHLRYLDDWFDALRLDRVVLVGYDWGGTLAMDWASRHPSAVAGLAVAEAFLRPMTWAEYPAAAVGFFRTLRTPGDGERLALEENWFIETALRATNPGIDDADLDVYRRPYPDPESRRPLLQWPREIPLDGTPADVAERFRSFGRWLAASPDVPKLLLTVEPGSLIPAPMVAWARDNMAGLEVHHLGAAGHHVPEDRPDEFGQALVDWLARHHLT